MKNSSRFDAEIATNLSRSRRGVVLTSASRRTRRLNFSQLNSRLKKYSGRFRSGARFCFSLIVYHSRSNRTLKP